MKVDKTLARFYGIMLGDGCLSFVKPKYYFISITGHAIDDRSFFHKIVKPDLEKYLDRQIKIKERKNKNTIELQPTCKKFFLIFNQMGFPIGLKGVNLHIPIIFKNHMKEIIQGYFATDGCLVLTNNHETIYPRIEFSSISKPLLEQVKEYLDQIGIRCAIYISKKKKGNNHILYRIQSNGINNLNLFRNNIGFVNPKHNIKYDKYIKYKKEKNADAGIGTKTKVF